RYGIGNGAVVVTPAGPGIKLANHLAGLAQCVVISLQRFSQAGPVVAPEALEVVTDDGRGQFAYRVGFRIVYGCLQLQQQTFSQLACSNNGVDRTRTRIISSNVSLTFA